MALEGLSVADLNKLIKTGVYLQIKGFADKILTRFAKISKVDDVLGDTAFWHFVLGEDEVGSVSKEVGNNLGQKTRFILSH